MEPYLCFTIHLHDVHESDLIFCFNFSLFLCLSSFPSHHAGSRKVFMTLNVFRGLHKLIFIHSFLFRKKKPICRHLKSPSYNSRLLSSHAAGQLFRIASLHPPAHCTSTVLQIIVINFTIVTHAKSVSIRLTVTTGSVLTH